MENEENGNHINISFNNVYYPNDKKESINFDNDLYRNLNKNSSETGSDIGIEKSDFEKVFCKHNSIQKSKEINSENYLNSEEDFYCYYHYLNPHPSFSQNIKKGIFVDEFTIIHENKNLNLDIKSNNENLNKSNKIFDEPEEILIFIVHGIGQNEQKLKTILNDRIKEMIKILYEKEDKKFTRSLHFRMIDWKTPLFIREKDNFDNLANFNNQTKFPKMFIQNVPLDLMQYMSERNKFKIINDVVSQINSYYYLVKKYRKNFNGNVSIIGHSLGSVIMYEILSNMCINNSYRNFGLNKFFNLCQFNKDLKCNCEQIKNEHNLNNCLFDEIFKEEKKNKIFYNHFIKEKIKKRKEKKEDNDLKKKSIPNQNKLKIVKNDKIVNNLLCVNQETKLLSFKGIAQSPYENNSDFPKENISIINNKDEKIEKHKFGLLEEEYFKKILLKKRNERKKTLKKIRIVDDINNNTFKKNENTDLNNNQENKDVNSNSKINEDNHKIIIDELDSDKILIVINNETILNKIDKNSLDLKNRNPCKQRKTKLENLKGNVNSNTCCQTISINLRENLERIITNNLENGNFEKLENLIEKPYSIDNRLNDSDYLIKNTITSQSNNHTSVKINDNYIKSNKKNEEHSDYSKKFRNRGKTILLDEITNTKGSLYSKITNTDLNSNINNKRNKKLEEMIENQLFDYKRRIYLKTQHNLSFNEENKSLSCYLSNHDKKLLNHEKLFDTDSRNLDCSNKIEYLEDFPENISDRNVYEIEKTLLNDSSIIDYHRFLRVFSKNKKIIPMIFSIEHFFTMGSPLALFLTIERGKNAYLYEMETIKDFHNIIHPMDPVAYRIEHLIYDYDKGENSCLLPNFLNKGIKNIFLNKILNHICS